jgi:hypothetical protein
MCRLIGTFKKFLTETENKTAQNELAFYLDIDAYLGSGEKSDKKTAMLAQLYK